MSQKILLTAKDGRRLYSKGEYLSPEVLKTGIADELLSGEYRFTRSLHTGISNSGSSVRLTRMVSPMPSSSKVPIPIADLILRKDVLVSLQKLHFEYV